MPKDLNSTYERILKNIDEDYKSEALAVLRWLLFCKRPLLLHEAAEVLAIDARETPAFNADRRLHDAESIIDICSSLVTVVSTGARSSDYWSAKHETREARLAHLSVKSYLLSDYVIPVLQTSLSTQAHLFLAEDSLAYLLNVGESENMGIDIVGKNPLIGYAAEYWYQHARKVSSEDNTETLDTLVMKLFSSPTLLLRWNQLQDIEKESTGAKERFHMAATDLASPLYYISCAGLARYVRRFCSNPSGLDSDSGHHEVDSTSNTFEGTYGSPLIAAASKGFQDVVEMLLEYKDSKNKIRGGNLGTALQAAAWNGNAAMVSCLIECGEDINIIAGRYGSALQAAASQGHVNVVRCLLESGADVNIGGGSDGSALSAAAFAGSADIVTLLLDAGAEIHRIKAHHRQYFCNPDFNPKTPSLKAGRLVLHIDDPIFTTCYNLNNSIGVNSSVNIEIVKKLLQKLPAPMKDQLYLADMLFIASLGGNAEIMEILLQETPLASDNRTALQTALVGALRSGHSTVVHLLMANGATFDWDQPEYPFQLLQAAAVSDSPPLLNLLLENRPPFHYKHVYMAFCYAVEACSEKEIFQLLLSQGLAFESQVWEKILLSTCCKLKPDVLEYILENTQVDVNVDTGRFGNALTKEARDGKIKCIPIWLKYGSEVSMECGRYGCALHAVIARGHLEGLRILLDAGADVNMIAVEGPALVAVLKFWPSNTAVHFRHPSAREQHFITEAVKLILSRKPDVDAVGRCDMTPLCLAVARGLTNVAYDLLTAGANRYLVDKFGRNALFWAVLRNNELLIEELLADTSHGDRMIDVIRAAMSVGSWELVDRLINRIPQAELNIADSSGTNCLFLAHFFKNEELAAKLRALGASVQSPDQYLESIRFLGSNTAPHTMVTMEGYRLQISGKYGSSHNWQLIQLHTLTVP